MEKWCEIGEVEERFQRHYYTTPILRNLASNHQLKCWDLTSNVDIS